MLIRSGNGGVVAATSAGDVMAGPNDGIVRHYSKGDLLARILEGVAALGKSADALQPEDLKPVDEFHIGGVAATDELLRQLRLAPGAEILDIGSGIGGTARHLAANYDVNVTGVDLTPEFVETARRLTELVGLDARFEIGSALDLPFDADRFDAATLIHVGMNLPDKARLFQEARRVLKPGGVFAVYDVMQTGADHPAFPLPWATAPDVSFLNAPGVYLEAGAAAGFEPAASRERGDFARDFFARLAASLAGASPPPLGLGILMGADAQTKVGNMVAAVGKGDIAPVEMIFRAPR